MKKFYLLLLLIPLFSLTSSKVDQCPVCYGVLMKTANSKAEFGKIIYEFKCPQNHSFWKPEKKSGVEMPKVEMPKVEMPVKSSCDCPICGWSGHHTSHPNVRKCGNDHEFSCN